MTEVWKCIPNEPNYMVSNLGNVKSLHYRNTNRSSVLEPIKDRYGYLHVYLGKKQYLVHRLVAMSFLGCDGNTETVDHINGIRSDNRLCNLRWMSRRENTLRGHELRGHSTNGRKNKPKMTKKEAIEKKRIPVMQFDKDGNLVCEYDSMMDAERKTGIGSGRISACINSKKKSAGGYTWKRKEFRHN